MYVINARFLTQNITGVQRFAIQISYELKKKLGSSVEYVSPKGIIHTSIANELEVKKIGSLKGYLWEQYDLPRYLKKKGSPLLINLCNTAPLLYRNKVVTIHDVAFEVFPEMFSFGFRNFYKFLVPKLYKTSKTVFTVSEFSKKEIIKYYGTINNDIHVIYNGISEAFKKNELAEKAKFILAVSSLNKRKNFKNLLLAYNELSTELGLKLYLIGDMNKIFKDNGLIDIIEENENIKFLGRVSDEKLSELYSTAEFFVFPSIYEGFGIPPLEAQSCGCPVIASNATSLPEVCGESVLYFNPYDVKDIIRVMLNVNSSNQVRDELVNKGFDNIKRFSWEKSAEKIKNIIEGLS